MKTQTIFNVLLLSAAALATPLRDLYVRQPTPQANPQVPSGSTPLPTAIPAAAPQVKTIIMDQLGSLGIDQQTLSTLRAMPATVFEKVSQLQEPQLTQAVTSLLKGQVPDGI
ncbi:hypothetical protein TWF481_006069 [Arthrobotrys musiformis]|uniref:Uncharacterized protein n=1 Tax=Arthrobotrys musiformis TaxID=47236 RepID=A0AAV9WLC7_9PEZI